MCGGHIAGIGVDLVENERVRQSILRWNSRFKDRIFTASEQAYCESKSAAWIHYAGRFAAKEAVSKAFGCGIGAHLGWLDIEVSRNFKTGEPLIELQGGGLRLIRKCGVKKIWISLSHTEKYTTAYVVLWAENQST